MPERVPFFRVFLSSPGDVNDERQAVLEILERLPNRPAFREQVGFRVVAWDKPGADTPMLATMSPQAAIDAGLPKPSECDIVVCILWSRMGTPFTMNSVDYLSGTHYELLEALNSKRPETVIYRRTEKKLFEAADTAGQEQYNRVQTFFAGALFYDPATKQIRRGVNHYSSPADFREKFETHLEDVVVRLLKKYAAAPQPTPEIAATGGTVITITTQAWPGSPFPGLRAFTERDALIFFGRNREADLLLRRLTDSRFVAVVGASGSGKSSLVGAGLIPRLRANAIADEQTGSKDWFIVRFTPGSSESPFAALFDALLETFPRLRPSAFEIRRVKQTFVHDLLQDPATLRDTLTAALTENHAPAWAEVVLFIDQFEELFTLAKPEFIAPFIQLLLATADNPRVRIIATMRSDFYAKAVEYPELAELLQTGSFPLAAPAAEALAQMIKRPAEIAALEFEEALPERILIDTGSTPGALALMAYALDELYKLADARHDRRITFGDYAALDGVQGAIGKRAEQTFTQLAIADKDTLFDHVFRELVEVDERGTATRQRCPIERFGAPELALVRAFTDARLLVMDALTLNPSSSDDGFNSSLAAQRSGDAPGDRTPGHEGIYVEVAHEALFRSWERLKVWIEERRDDFILLRQVRNATHEWQTKHRPDYLRWPQERLKLVDAMRERLRPELNEVEQSFIEPEQTRLLRELEDIRTSHQRRRWIGERLAMIGDTRPGIGCILLSFPRAEVGRGGGSESILLPQIAWLPVTPGGEIEIEGQTFSVQPFYIAKYLVTYSQFQRFVDAPDGFEDERWWQGFPAQYIRQALSTAIAQYDNYPRDSMSWYQCVAFARWMSHRLQGLRLPHPGVGTRPALSVDDASVVPTEFVIGENAEIRLPTEWEWQWMAQNGAEARPYPWGEWDEHPRANTSESGIGDRSMAVGMYPHGAAGGGALDVSGNLWEWSLNDYLDPKIMDGYANSERKVLRGGSFNDFRSVAAASYRRNRHPNSWDNYYGLRLVVGAPISAL